VIWALLHYNSQISIASCGIVTSEALKLVCELQQTNICKHNCHANNTASETASPRSTRDIYTRCR